MVNPTKTGRLPIGERLDRLRAATAGLANVTVDAHAGGLLVDYCRAYCRAAGIDVVVRGIRDGRDLDHEMSMAHMNRELSGIETFFIAADPEQAHLSSTLVTAMGAGSGRQASRGRTATEHRPTEAEL